MWKQRLIETARGTFELFEKGEGEPLAITHFYMAFNEKGNWFANPFTEHYKVFLINVRGAGNSPEVIEDEQMSFTEIIQDLEAIRSALQIEKWAFAGHSTGGMLALQYAIDAQASLTKVIAGCTAASKAYASHPSSIYCSKNKNFQRMIEIMEALNNPNTPQQSRSELSFEWAVMSFVEEGKWRQALLTPNSGLTVGRALDYFRKVLVKTYDIRDQLSEISIPAYIFGGKYDAQCPIQFTYEIADHIPSAQLTVFEQSNHNPFVEEKQLFESFVLNTL